MTYTISNAEKSVFPSEFGEQLFHGFCAHPNRTHIAIRKCKKLPPKLGEALFGAEFPQQLDLSLVEKVFPSALRLTLNHLDKKQMAVECEVVRDVLALVVAKTQLIDVVIQSAPHERIQESGELKIIAEDVTINKKLRDVGWSVAYMFQKEARMHRLVFSIDKDECIQKQGLKIKEMELRMKEMEKAQAALEKAQVEMVKAQKEIEMLKNALRQNGIDLPANTSSE